MPISPELTAKIEGLRSNYDSLQNEYGLADVTSYLGNIATQIEGLPGKIKGLRQRGYAYASYLEGKVETLGNQWQAIHTQINSAVQEELERAQDELDELDSLWDRLDNALTQTDAEAAQKLAKPKGSLSSDIRAVVEAQKADKKSDMVGKLAKMGDKGSKGAPATAALAGLGKDKAEKPAGATAALAGLGAKTAAAKADDKVEDLASQLENAMKRAQTAIGTAKERINGLYGQVPSNVSQTQSQISEIEKYLERIEKAAFELLAGEDIFIAIEAKWKDKNADEPEGMVYITNRRLLMEQREKKGGFLGMGGKKVENVLWESPLGAISEVKAEQKGMMGRTDLIHLQFGSGGPFGNTTIEVKDADADDFARRLKRAISGDIEKERGIAHDPQVVEALKDAPTTCSVCGATFSDPITKGMTEMHCAYCGSVVRLGM